MNRREFLISAAAGPILACLDCVSRADAVDDASAVAPTSIVSGWRRFEITMRVTLPSDSGAAQLWLPLAQTAGDYQSALQLRWQGNGQTQRIHDARYGAPLLHTAWDGKSDAPPQVEVIQTVAARDRTASLLLPLTQAERQFWTAPAADDDAALQAAVGRITAGLLEPRAKLRAIYDWVVDHTYRDPDVPGCGAGDYRQALRTGTLGGKCADINSLLVGLARAAGFPAREVYGLRVADSRFHPCLGRRGDVSKAQHCRAEVFLDDDEGWFPLDPADVRKVVLEEKLPLDSAEGRALREKLFGFWEMNWVGYNSAAGIELPGAERPQKPDFVFLMYPHAITTKGVSPCLNPAAFRYEITARELDI